MAIGPYVSDTMARPRAGVGAVGPTDPANSGRHTTAQLAATLQEPGTAA